MWRGGQSGKRPVKLTCEHRPWGSEGASTVAVWEKGVSGREEAKCCGMRAWSTRGMARRLRMERKEQEGRKRTER